MFERMLVPVDGSNISMLLAKTAAEMAGKFHSEVVLFHVLQLPLPMEVLQPGKEETGEIYEQIKARIEKFGNRVLEAAAGQFIGIGVTLFRKAVWGDPAGEIIKEVSSGSYDLVVIGSRGLDDVEAWLMGSVSERVVRRSGCPVLVIR